MTLRNKTGPVNVLMTRYQNPVSLFQDDGTYSLTHKMVQQFAKYLDILIVEKSGKLVIRMDISGELENSIYYLNLYWYFFINDHDHP